MILLQFQGPNYEWNFVPCWCVDVPDSSGDNGNSSQIPLLRKASDEVSDVDPWSAFGKKWFAIFWSI